jgi:uncharacterized membrane protein YphA (DoxX/SURF4 family)
MGTDRAACETRSVAGSSALLVLRVGLAGVFLVAAYFKLFQSALSGGIPSSSPQTFLEAIQAFKVVQDDRLVTLATFWIPWTELVCGVALLLGLWTRAAALILGLLLALFIALISSTIWRNGAAVEVLQGHLAALSPDSPARAGILEQIDHLKNLKCGCFGNYKLICEGTVNWCKIAENSGLLLVAMTILTCGAGLLSLDSLLGCCRRKEA